MDIIGIAVAAIAYVVGGITLAGIEHANYRRKYKATLATDRDNLLLQRSWVVCFVGLFWPILAIPILLASNFGEDGWSLSIEPTERP